MTFTQLSNFELISATLYYSITLTIVLIPNMASLILMISVLYHLYSSMKQLENFDNQEKLLNERKRIAWVVIAQCISNLCLTGLRIIGFYNISLFFASRPVLMCYNSFLNFYNSFSYTIQEVFVCINCIIDLFVLTPYREQLVIFGKKFRY